MLRMALVGVLLLGGAIARAQDRPSPGLPPAAAGVTPLLRPAPSPLSPPGASSATLSPPNASSATVSPRDATTAGAVRARVGVGASARTTITRQAPTPDGNSITVQETEAERPE